MKYLHLELKVCEGCGMLWLRRKQLEDQSRQTAGIHCAGCETRLAQFPSSAGKRGGGRPRTEGPRTRVRRNRGCAAARHANAGDRGTLSLRGHKAGER